MTTKRKPGRPKGVKHRKPVKRNVVRCYLSDGEYSEFMDVCDHLGIKASVYVRQRLMNAVSRALDKHEI